MNRESIKKINNFKKEFSKIKLSKTQKHAILAKVYKESNYIPSVYISPYHKFLKTKVIAMAMIALFVLSGTTYAAHHSVPGDILYPVKTDIIEPVRIAMTFNFESKQEYTFSLIDERISEIKTLESKNKLSEKKVQQSHQRIIRNLEVLTPLHLNEQKALEVKSRLQIYNEIISDFHHLKVPLEKELFESIKNQSEQYQREENKESFNTGNRENDVPIKENGSENQYNLLQEISDEIFHIEVSASPLDFPARVPIEIQNELNVL